MGNIRLIKINVAILIVIYCMGALVNWSFNPISWGWLSRIAMIFWLCSGVYYVYNNFAHTDFSVKVCNILFGAIVISAAFYTIASLCSWSFNLTHWNYLSILLVFIGSYAIFDYSFYVMVGMIPEKYFLNKKHHSINKTKSPDKKENFYNGPAYGEREHASDFPSPQDYELDEYSDFAEWFFGTVSLDETGNIENIDYYNLKFYTTNSSKSLHYNDLINLIIVEFKCSKEKAEELLKYILDPLLPALHRLK